VSRRRTIPLAELAAGMTVQMPADPGSGLDRATVRILAILPAPDGVTRAHVQFLYGGRALSQRQLDLPDGTYIVKAEAAEQAGGAA
jgi:hypothetical protein